MPRAAKPALAAPGKAGVTKRFRARVRSEGPGGAWSFIHLPFSVAEAWGTKGFLRVRGTANGAPFRNAVQPLGDGVHAMMFSRALQAASGAAPGDTVAVVMRPDLARRVVKAPPELAAALKVNKAAAEHWESLAPSHRKEYAVYITEAKRPETRKARVEKAVRMLAEGRRAK